jgi:hypothetical protein
MAQSPSYTSRLPQPDDHALPHVEVGLGYASEEVLHVAEKPRTGEGTILSQMVFHDPTFRTNPTKTQREIQKPVSQDSFHRLFEDDDQTKAWKLWKADTDSRAIARFKALTEPTPEKAVFPAGDILERKPGVQSVSRRNEATYDKHNSAKLTGLDYFHDAAEQSPISVHTERRGTPLKAHFTAALAATRLQRTASPNIDALVATDEKRQHSIKKREEAHAVAVAAARDSEGNLKEPGEITKGLV